MDRIARRRDIEVICYYGHKAVLPFVPVNRRFTPGPAHTEAMITHLTSPPVEILDRLELQLRNPA